MFSDIDKDGEIDAANELLSISNYYPFGMSWESNTKTSPLQRHLYNGKELDTDFGLNVYFYGARLHDPALGRFTTTDRFAEKYASMSPYGYGANNPIKFIDVNGDSIKVTNGGRTLLYENGSFYENGKLVGRNNKGKIAGKGSGFFRATEGMLAKLNATDAGKGVINELQSSTNVFDIKYSTGKANFIAGFTGFGTPELINNASAFQVMAEGKKIIKQFTFNQIGSGGTIYFDPSISINTTTTTGNLKEDPTIILGHELYHAYEANKGLLDGNPILHGNGSGIIREIRAVHYGNTLRQQMGKNYFRTGNGSSINAAGKLIAPPQPTGINFINSIMRSF